MDMLKGVVKGQVAAQTLGPPHWQDGLCDCTQDTGICCQTLCCTPCTAANMLNKRDHGVGAFDCCACICWLAATYGTGDRYPVWEAMSYRRELVQRYGIRDEKACNSCLLAQCCTPCVYCQVQREMGKRKEHCGGCCANPPADQPNMADKALGMVGQMAGAAILNGARPPRMWLSGLCDCSCMECLEGIFCPCCIFGYVNSRLDAERVNGVVSGTMDPASCCGSLWYLDAWTFANRREVMERYNIIGESHIMSLVKVLCCPFCTILQQRREMGYENEWPGGLCVKVPPPRK